MANDKKTLIVCAGMQSGGTTLVSYCFLQRADTNGVLDAEYDLLPRLDAQLARPYAWYKTTICCFRLVEIVDYYRDAGWEVRPLLVLRDLRSVWASLKRKDYGRNGITAEDPPLRMRLRRFVDDWRQFAKTGATTFRYEDFIVAPETTLQQACSHLGLPWDSAMLMWPKPPAQVADQNSGSSSFWNSRGNTLADTIARYGSKKRQLELPGIELEWLETEFREFNEANGYPLHLNGVSQPSTAPSNDFAAPNFEITRRYEWETRRKPLRWILSRLGRRNEKLISTRSWKRAA